jgi:hypothetical protein
MGVGSQGECEYGTDCVEAIARILQTEQKNPISLRVSIPYL